MFMIVALSALTHLWRSGRLTPAWSIRLCHGMKILQQFQRSGHQVYILSSSRDTYVEVDICTRKQKASAPN